MKKSLVLVLVASLLLSVVSFTASALTFTDLAENHWAYDDVQTLVKDGTVSGYGDGTFRPNGTVTRAEFVKMLGMINETRPQNYSDVPAEHWAYKYVMSSGFPETETNNFFPDTPITRGLVAELLWNRGGKPTNAFAPSIITSQYSKKPEAIAWVYATGLMQGDDGISLRLKDTLSRAEAATLIIRSRQAKEANVVFANTVSPKIMENVYNGLKLFDNKKYEPDATITNGEMARAAVRIGSEETNLTYYGLNASPAFDHPYAMDIAVITQNCLGTDKNTAAFADKKATFGDSVAALVHQFITKSKTAVAYGATTEGLPKDTSKMANIVLTFAKNNGIISLKEDLTAPITLREFTAICLLLDDLIGSQSDIASDLHPLTGDYVQKNHSLALTEASYGNFRVKLENMPSAVYSKAFVKQASIPAESYDFAREYSSIFTGMLQQFKLSAEERSGVKLQLTYYPSLVCDNGNGYTMRVACKVLDLNSAKTFSEVFPTANGMAGADTKLSKDSVLYFDVATGETIKSVFLSDEKAFVEQIVLAQ